MVSTLFGRPVLPFGQYNTTPATLTDGQVTPLQVDDEGQLKITGTVGVGTVTTNPDTRFTFNGSNQLEVDTNLPLNGGSTAVKVEDTPLTSTVQSVRNPFAVITNDTTEYTGADAIRAIYHGSSEPKNLVVKFTTDGSAVTFANLAPGMVHPIAPLIITTDTTATAIIAERV
jgi:hypothetical protein